MSAHEGPETPEAAERKFALELTADRPIQSPAEDRLGRSPLAHELAAAIAGWRETESLVIAIYGEWGIGKSSLKNLAVRQLREQAAGRVDVLEFNPWQWQGHEQLATALFREILQVLGKRDESKKARKIVRALRRYAAYLGLGSAVFAGPKGLVTAALTVVGLLTVGASLLTPPEHLLILGSVLAATLLAIAALLKWGQGILERLAAWRELGLPESESLQEHKRAVIEALEGYDKSLLVVVDDIDRLTAAETQSVFQLIKANADFPKFIYLVLFQRDVVEKALARMVRSSGSNFLEKIVQIGFDLPAPRQDEIDNVVFSGVSRVLGEQNVGRLNQGYWGNIYYGGIRQYFGNLRDVKRFLASLSFHRGLLHTNGRLNVNAVDLIALDVLRVFEPKFYKALRDAKDLLTHDPSSESSEKTKRAETIKALLNGVPVERQRGLKEVVRLLFPRAAFAFGGMSYGPEFMTEWDRDLRVCSPGMFDRYFSLTLPSGDISEHELQALLAMAGEPKSFTAELSRLRSEGKLDAALDRLDVNRDKIPLEHVVSLAVSLFDISDDFAPDPPGSMSSGPRWTVQRIVHNVLKREADPARRAELLTRILENSAGLSMAVMCVSLQGDRSAKTQSGEQLVPEASLPGLQAVCVRKIREAAATGRLMQRSDLAYILYRWRDWSSVGEARDWVKKLAGSPAGALVLVKAFTHRSISQGVGDHVARINVFVRYSELEVFVDLDAVDAEIGKLNETKLQADDRQSIEAFRRAMKRKRAGKPEGAFGWDSDDDETP
ncbi:MAG: KAP family P-loop NTPase fold protein [Burkholderiales bacterium]